MARGLPHPFKALAWLCWACAAQAFAHGPANPHKPAVWIGFDDGFGLRHSSSAMATEWGIRAALEEINQAGGVLNGRPLKLITTDNKGVSARGKDNFVQLAVQQDLVAILSGRMNPITLEMLPEAHRLKVPLISVWGSADLITDHEYKPSYSFRVSIKDEWGVEAMMRRLSSSHGVRQACAILPKASGGHSVEKVILEKKGAHTPQFPVLRWYNLGEASFKEHYQACLDARTQGLLFVGHGQEAALLIQEIAAQPLSKRLPVVAHMGATGSTLHDMVKDDLAKVRIDFVQTFSFVHNRRPRAIYLANWVMKNQGFNSPHQIPSPVGVAHAYDTVHLLAKAIDMAKTTSPSKIRDALETLPAFDGAVRHYAKAFTPQRHDALDKSQILFVRMTPPGHLIPHD